MTHDEAACAVERLRIPWRHQPISTDEIKRWQHALTDSMTRVTVAEFDAVLEAFERTGGSAVAAARFQRPCLGEFMGTVQSRRTNARRGTVYEPEFLLEGDPKVREDALAKMRELLAKKGLVGRYRKREHAPVDLDAVAP